MNGLCKSSHVDLKDAWRIDIAWKARIHTFMRSPLPCRRIRRQETSETNLMGESLETLLSKKSGRGAFREFLKSEFCEENLDFWLACQEFQTSVNRHDQAKTAARIYEEFIRADSPKEVNLDFCTREIIRQNLQQPSSSCFAAAQKKIYSLMENGSFPRFVQSEHYKILIDAASEQRGLKKHRMASRIKTAGDDLKVDRQRD